MEDTLISFQVAKLAKEKGFDGQCFYYYDKTEKLIEPYEENGSSTDVEFRVNLTDLLDNYNERYRENYSAPTQTLLQKWLREVHEMYVLVSFDSILFDVSIYGKYTPEHKEIKITSFLTQEPTFYTYEQALEAGLIKALELI